MIKLLTELKAGQIDLTKQLIWVKSKLNAASGSNDEQINVKLPLTSVSDLEELEEMSEGSTRAAMVNV